MWIQVSIPIKAPKTDEPVPIWVVEFDGVKFPCPANHHFVSIRQVHQRVRKIAYLVPVHHLPCDRRRQHAEEKHVEMSAARAASAAVFANGGTIAEAGNCRHLCPHSNDRNNGYRVKRIVQLPTCIDHDEKDRSKPEHK